MSYTVDKRLLNEGDVCHRCEKDLRTVQEIHVSEGMHFCSKACAVAHYTDEVIRNARESAIALYEDYAEIVKPVDIGITKEVLWHSYSKETDLTTILMSVYGGSKVISTEVVGFYFGEPSTENDTLYKGSLKAAF